MVFVISPSTILLFFFLLLTLYHLIFPLLILLSIDMLRLGLSKTRLSKGLPRSIWLLSSKQSPVTSQVRGWKGSLGQGDLRSHWLGVSYPCPRFHNPYSTATLPLTSEVREEDSSECLPPSHEYYTLSFYRFTPLPPEHCEDLRALFYQALDTLGVVGRIYLAAEGINAQISCPSSHFDALRAWCDHQDPPAITSTLAQLKQNLVSNIRFNWATKHGRSFDELDIRVRKYLVSDGLDPASYDLTLAPTYLSPEEWHRELSQLPSSSSSPDAPLLIDMRNHYESEIGHFEGALRPDVDTFREELVQVQRLAEENPRRTIYMYCTGGIRCSKAGAILRSKGCEDVRAVGHLTLLHAFLLSPFHLLTHPIFLSLTLHSPGTVGWGDHSVCQLHCRAIPTSSISLPRVQLYLR